MLFLIGNFVITVTEGKCLSLSDWTARKKTSNDVKRFENEDALNATCRNKTGKGASDSEKKCHVWLAPVMTVTSHRF